MSLRYNGQDIALVTFTGMTSQKAIGGWLLRFSLTFEPRPIPKSSFFNFEADGVYDLRVHVSVSAGASEPLFLGVAHCRQQRFFQVNDMAQRQGHLFDLSLLEGQLAAIEAIRGTGGVTFQFDVFAQGSGSLNALPMETSLRHEFNLSEWSRRLAEMGVAEYLCIPMQLPQPAAGDPHEPAIKHLRRAQEAMLRGDWRAAVASCRESLDLLTALQERAFASSNLTTQSVIQSFGTRRKQMSREERLVFLRVAAVQLTHLAHHPTESPRDVLSREDASLVLAACAGLLSASLADGFAPPPAQS